MKKIWTVLSVLAVANLFALAGFVAWLVNSDRLNMDRVREVRTMLVRTIAQDKTDAEAAAKTEEAAKVQAEKEQRASRPPLTAEERLAARVEATELDRQRMERLKREVADLKSQLALERSTLETERAAFAEQQKAFTDAIASSNAAASDAQFQKTLGVIQSQKPSGAVILLKQMLIDPAPAVPPDAGSGPLANGATPEVAPVAPAANASRMATVVGYLDAMDEKHRSKIMTELTKTDPKLAAELLERLRKQGEFARVPQDRSMIKLDTDKLLARGITSNATGKAAPKASSHAFAALMAGLNLGVQGGEFRAAAEQKSPEAAQPVADTSVDDEAESVPDDEVAEPDAQTVEPAAAQEAGAETAQAEAPSAESVKSKAGKARPEPEQEAPSNGTVVLASVKHAPASSTNSGVVRGQKTAAGSGAAPVASDAGAPNRASDPTDSVQADQEHGHPAARQLQTPKPDAASPTTDQPVTTTQAAQTESVQASAPNAAREQTSQGQKAAATDAAVTAASPSATTANAPEVNAAAIAGGAKTVVPTSGQAASKIDGILGAGSTAPSGRAAAFKKLMDQAPVLRQSIERSAFVAQVARGLGAALRKGDGVVNLRLTPENLGLLKVQITLAGSGVTAKFEASTESARRLLAESQPSLKAALEARGLSVERIEVTVAGQAQGSAPEAPHHNETSPDGPGTQGPGDGRGGSPGTGAEAHTGEGRNSAEAHDFPEPESAHVDLTFGTDVGGVYRLRLDAVA